MLRYPWVVVAWGSSWRLIVAHEEGFHSACARISRLWRARWLCIRFAMHIRFTMQKVDVHIPLIFDAMYPPPPWGDIGQTRGICMQEKWRSGSALCGWSEIYYDISWHFVIDVRIEYSGCALLDSKSVWSSADSGWAFGLGFDVNLSLFPPLFHIFTIII
jgi:hypothetical protein